MVDMHYYFQARVNPLLPYGIMGRMDRAAGLLSVLLPEKIRHWKISTRRFKMAVL